MFITIRLEKALVLNVKSDMITIARLNGISKTGRFMATQIEIGGFSQTDIMFVDDGDHKIEAGYFMDAHKVEGLRWDFIT